MVGFVKQRGAVAPTHGVVTQARQMDIMYIQSGRFVEAGAGRDGEAVRIEHCLDMLVAWCNGPRGPSERVFPPDFSISQ